ncbi:MAG: hypothetical protein HUU60_09325 [Armatimonadetes bacterium]|nr:hypothetical protein [Armatimonadota bacterium]
MASRRTSNSRRTARRRPEPPKERDARFYDRAAFGLAAAGALALVCLILPDSGEIGRALRSGLTLTFGMGAFIFPLMFWVAAVAIYAGKERRSAPEVLIGSALLFVTVLAALANPPASGNWYDAEFLKAQGGYVGSVSGFLLHVGFGAARPFVLAIMAILAVMMIASAPIATIAQSIWRGLSSGWDRASTGAKVVTGAATNVSEKAVVALRKPVRERPVREKLELEPEPETKQIEPSPKLKRVAKLDAPRPVGEYQLPPITLLQPAQPQPKRSQPELKQKIEVLERTLEEFGIGSNVVEIAHGPTVTRYEIQLDPGIKVSKVVNLADNLAMALAAIAVRVEAPIPGKSAIGVEVPNDHPQIVTLREVMDDPKFWKPDKPLMIALGKDVGAQNKFADLTQMPHMLIGGSTNSGKSMCLLSLISCLLFRSTPDQVRLVLIDPKRVELSLFAGIPHLMCPVVKNVAHASGAFRAVLREMDRRYELFATSSVRNIIGYNEKVQPHERLPYVVVVVDELADLMMQAAGEVEDSITRVAQLARATGIHLVIATQRPSVDVITGTIKANISSRIAFAVSSQIDSRTILDKTGAERLLGRGDMLFMPIDSAKPTRIQGCYVSESEISEIVNFWKAQGEPSYLISPEDEGETGGGRRGSFDEEEEDAMYVDAVKVVVAQGQASTSLLQRRLKIGYGRAARLLDIMERRGIVSPLDGPRPRQILISRDEARGMFGDDY